ncbi:MAG TPA: hypothetical protein VN765_02410 [Candidatus Acidoferrum sp.]|nr:hypothetical protein [Candidatus Acidoferrum sp.]
MATIHDSFLQAILEVLQKEKSPLHDALCDAQVGRERIKNRKILERMPNPSTWWVDLPYSEAKAILEFLSKLQLSHPKARFGKRRIDALQAVWQRVVNEIESDQKHPLSIDDTSDGDTSSPRL